MYCISVKELFENFGSSLIHTDIVHMGEYYDLYDKSGKVVCLDGEECNVLSVDDQNVVLENKCGEEPVIFKLLLKEFDIAAFRA